MCPNLGYQLKMDCYRKKKAACMWNDHQGIKQDKKKRKKEDATIWIK